MGAEEEIKLNAMADLIEAYEARYWPDGKEPGGKGRSVRGPFGRRERFPNTAACEETQLRSLSNAVLNSISAPLPRSKQCARRTIIAYLTDSIISHYNINRAMLGD
jgi:hypothetical protein